MTKTDKIIEHLRRYCAIDDDTGFLSYESGPIYLGDMKVNVKIERLER